MLCDCLQQCTRRQIIEDFFKSLKIAIEVFFSVALNYLKKLNFINTFFDNPVQIFFTTFHELFRSRVKKEFLAWSRQKKKTVVPKVNLSSHPQKYFWLSLSSSKIT